MNKKKVLESIIAALEHDWSAASNAAKQARETATHTESVAKTKYDTFGLEASYLAHGQSKRVFELAEGLEVYKGLSLLEFDFDTEIATSALVHLESEDGDTRWIFIGPTEGGLTVKYRDVGHSEVEIVVVTGNAPLGKKLLGKVEGDEVAFSAGKQVKIFEIVKVL